MMDQHAEDERLKALLSYAILDTDAEPPFDRFVRLAARLFSAPMALISFVDDRRQWFKARLGLDLAETPRAISFCTTAIQRDEVCVVHDTHLDPRFAENPLVLSGPLLRFYAGAPLIVPGGYRLGTLCVMDTVPRPGFGPDDAAILADLAAMVVAELELRRERRGPHRTTVVINDILTALADANTLLEGFNRTMARVTAATDATFSALLEHREGDDLVHLVTTIAGPGRTLPDYAGMFHDMPLPRTSVAVSKLFASDGGTVTRQLHDDPTGDFPILQRAQVLGIGGIVALSLHISAQRFVLVVCFDGFRDDLDDIAALLERLGQAIRPVLHRKLVHERLALISRAVAATPDSLVITEVDPHEPLGRIVFVNAGFSRMTGWQADEVQGLNPRILHSPEADRAELDHLRAALSSGQPVSTELLNRRRDGTPFWAELNMSPLAGETGEHTHWVTVQRDVTERHLATDLLHQREQEARMEAAEWRRRAADLALAADIAHMGSWRWTAKDRKTTWSPEVYRLFGVGQDFVPTPESTQALIHPDDRERTAGKMALATGQGANPGFDFRILGHEGTVRTCRSEGICEFDADGHVLAVHGFYQDVTERRQAEALALRAEKLNSIAQLAGGIAHDFNNILTVISLNLEIACDMLGEDHPVYEMLHPAMQAADSGAQLTSRLLSFARRQPLRPRAIDVNKLVSDISQHAIRTLGERCEVKLDLEAESATCQLDQGQFESAMLGLLLNSRDAMRDGGAITLRTETVTVGDGASHAPADLPPGRYATVAVSDTGSGIAPELQSKVFEPFFTTKTVGKGAGLGLSMVMGFIRQSGGQVELTSEPGHGTTVRLYLPAVPRPDPGSLANPPA